MCLLVMRRLASYYPFGLYFPFEVETCDSLVLIRHRQYWYKVFFLTHCFRRKEVTV